MMSLLLPLPLHLSLLVHQPPRPGAPRRQSPAASQRQQLLTQTPNPNQSNAAVPYSPDPLSRSHLSRTDTPCTRLSYPPARSWKAGRSAHRLHQRPVVRLALRELLVVQSLVVLVVEEVRERGRSSGFEHKGRGGQRMRRYTLIVSMNLFI